MCALEYHFVGNVTSLITSSRQARRPTTVLTTSKKVGTRLGGVLGGVVLEASEAVGHSCSYATEFDELEVDIVRERDIVARDYVFEKNMPSCWMVEIE